MSKDKIEGPPFMVFRVILWRGGNPSGKVGREVFDGTYLAYVCNEIFYTYFVNLGHSVLISDSHQNILLVNTLAFSGPRMVNSR